MNIGRPTQLAQKRRSFTQAVWGEREKFPLSSLSLLDRGRRAPPLSTIKRIAAALVMPVEILFFLGAEDGELGQLNRDLAGQLAITALELLNEPLPEQTELPS